MRASSVWSYPVSCCLRTQTHTHTQRDQGFTVQRVCVRTLLDGVVPASAASQWCSGVTSMCVCVCVCSQVFPKQLLLNMLPPEVDVLCTHPMFGPDSGRGSWQVAYVHTAQPHRSSRAGEFTRCSQTALCCCPCVYVSPCRV